jgi:hypothetical protein
MTNTPSGFTICLTPGADPADQAVLRTLRALLAETFNNPTLTELTTSAHSHRKVCP